MRSLRRATALLAVLALSGCGSSNRVHVEGVLLKGGAAFKPPEGASNQVVFVAMDVQDDSGKSVKSNEPYAAIFHPEDATFEVPGPEGRGIPPGKYRVSVTQKYRTKHTVDQPKKRGEPAINRDTDLLKDRFSPTDSPIIVEVPASEKLTIDLDRPQGSPSR